MRKAVVVLGLVLLTAIAFAQDAKPKAKVFVVFYSAKGHTQAMAEAVAKGARAVEGAEVKVASVAEAKVDDVLAADAVIAGSPVYKGNVAPPLQEFINNWPIKDGALKDKLGAAFATGSGISGGEELTQMSILHSMLVCNMIVVGGPDARQPFGASAITGENPSPKADDKETGLVSEYYLKKGEALGERVARLAVRMKASK
jgi:NAD(P)H dehydrogenase (quinone)